MNISKIAEAFGYIDDRFLKEAELPQSDKLRRQSQKDEIRL